MSVGEVLVWAVALLLLTVAGYVAVAFMLEYRVRAAALGGALFAATAASWSAAALLLPGWHAAMLVSFALGALVLLALLFAPVRGKPVLPAEPKERFDERRVIFARARYASGDGKYEAFYGEFPELKDDDDAIRALPRLCEPGGSTYDPLNAPLADAVFRWIDRVRDTVDGPVAAGRAALSPRDASERLKGLALSLGAVAAGTTAVRPGHVYSRVGRGAGEWGSPIDPGQYPFALVFAVEMKHEMIAPAPHQPVIVESASQYLQAAKIALAIAEYLRLIGYPARAHIDGNYRLVLPPLAADAGLGEVGRLSLLITPEYGPRVRLGAVTTALPLAQDEPKTFGVWDFCNLCLKCARNCPSGAIPEGGKGEVRGTTYWRIDAEKCYRFWRRVGTDCGLCIAVCPYSHPRAPLHSFVRAACRSNGASRRIFSLADDLFFGRRPRSSRHPRWMLAGLEDPPRGGAG